MRSGLLKGAEWRGVAQKENVYFVLLFINHFSPYNCNFVSLPYPTYFFTPLYNPSILFWLLTFFKASIFTTIIHDSFISLIKIIYILCFTFVPHIQCGLASVLHW